MIKIKKQFNAQKITFSVKGAKIIGHSYAKKMNLNVNITYFTKVNKIDHKLKYKTIKLFKLNVEQNLWGFGVGIVLLLHIRSTIYERKKT